MRREKPRCEKSERRVRALFFLAQAAAYHAGYQLCRVYGWVHAHDLKLLAGPYRWAELLAELEEEGHVAGHAASLADAPEPARLYRITQHGMNEIASEVRQRAPEVAPPGAADEVAAVYVSEGARWALEALRGAPGVWMSHEAISEPSERWNRSGGRPYRFVFYSHTDELVSAGLALVRHCPAQGRKAPPRRVYRVSESGLTIRLLTWAGAHPESDFYEVNRQLTPRPFAGVIPWIGGGR